MERSRRPRRKSLAALFLSLCFLNLTGLFGLFGIPVEATTGDQPIVLENMVQMNPCYANVLSEEQERAELEEIESRQQISSYELENGENQGEEEEEYLSFEEAGKLLRHYMKDRNNSFSIYVRMKEAGLSGEEVWNLLLEEAIIHTGVSTEGDYLRWGWKSIKKPELTEKKNGTTSDYTLNIIITYMTTAEEETEVTEAIEQIYEELNLDEKTKYEKVQVIYDYVFRNVAYDRENAAVTEQNENTTEFKHAHAAYGAVVNGKAVCQGYSSLMYRLLLENGIDTRFIASSNHGWNIIELDGMYYNGDTTWDSSNENYEHFLVGSGDFRIEDSHRPIAMYVTPEFLDEYPVSSIDYADVLNQTIVADSGTCGTELTWELSSDGTLYISGSGAMTDLKEESSNHWNEKRGWIKKVIVEDGVTSIGDYAFFNCPALKEISLPDSLETIGGYAFSYCDSLEKISIPYSVQTIADTAFDDCYRLTSIIYEEKEEESLPFTDVSETSWYYDAVNYVYDNKIMNGITDTTFGPNQQLTRAMFATILYRINGAPEVEYEAVFPDVPKGEWYTEGILWAYQNGIVNGYPNGNFGTEDNIEREQLAVMMYRYAGYMGYDRSQAEDFDAYVDGDKVSSYAIDGMGWAVGSGIVNGKDSGGEFYLDPQGQATRAECAAIVMRFLELYK